MTDKDVKALALFFFYVVLDDRRALQLASTAADLLSQKLAKAPDSKNSIVLVIAAQAIWEKFRHRWARGRPHFSSDAGWLLPEDIDLSAWKEFQKTAPEDELLTLVWSKIVRISDEDISAALGLSQGTVRYRVGRALKKMGALVHSGGKRKFEVLR